MTGPDEEFHRRRRQRSLVTAGLLVCMILLFYSLTLVRLHG